MAEPRRSFGPVVLLGLGSATLAAVASANTWVEAGGSVQVESSGEMPLALALSLVLLAAWGVLLVTRRVVRRAVALLAALAAAGLVATVVTGYLTLPDQVRAALADAGATGLSQVERTVWLWAAATGAVLSMASAALAVRLVGHWPEMGSRYDAPGAEGGPAPDPEDQTSLDLWKAMDEGRDPTA